jgi:hypothetical protein
VGHRRLVDASRKIADFRARDVIEAIDAK